MPVTIPNTIAHPPAEKTRRGAIDISELYEVVIFILEREKEKNTSRSDSLISIALGYFQKSSVSCVHAWSFRY